MIVKSSNKEESFILELKNVVGSINTTNIPNCDLSEKIVDKFMLMTENTWNKHLKWVKITRCFRYWWNETYSNKLNLYCLSKSISN